MRVAILMTAALCTGATSQAQATWTEVTGLGTTIPETRRESPGAADLTSMYVFGGTAGSGARLNDLWQFTGGAWTELTTNGAAGSPSGRTRPAIAWDHNNSQLVVFGGNDGATTIGDTWTWDTTNGWIQHFPATSPPALQFTQAAYDGFNDNVLLFGGQDGSGADRNETWSWDGSNWTQLSPATVPGPRRQHGMAARPDQDDIVMCCGQVGSAKLGDTYVWNGTDWSLVPTTVSPAPRVAMDMTYDEVRQRLVIPGGNNSSGNPIGTIAEFDGTDWVNLPIDSLILKRTRYFLAYVPSLGKSYMFGGQQVGQPLPTGTFQYGDPSPGTSFCAGDGSGATCPCGNLGGAGEGCANSAGSGATLVAAGSANVALDDISFSLAQGPAGVPAIVFSGALQTGGGSGVLFGDGLRCAGGAIQRLDTVFLDGTGSGVWGPGLAPQAGWMPGDTRYLQGWFRDNVGPCGSGFNTTNGLIVDFL